MSEENDQIENDQIDMWHDHHAMWHEIERLRADLAQRTADLETERLRLAACGVAALSNTPDSAAESRRIQTQYRSASFDDVVRAVDREMALRAEVATLKAERDEATKAERERCLRIIRSVNNHSNPMTANDCADLIERGEVQP